MVNIIAIQQLYVVLAIMVIFLTNMHFPGKYVRMPPHQHERLCAEEEEMGRVNSAWIEFSVLETFPLDRIGDEHLERVSCCTDSYSFNRPPCYVGMQSVPIQILTHVQGAWMLPLVAVFGNLFHALYAYYIQKIERHQQYEIVKATGRRLVFYVILLIYRTVVLYSGWHIVEEVVFGAAPVNCAYRHWRRCVRPFDTSDHVVLFLTHYGAISVLEVLAMKRSYSSKHSRWMHQVIYAWLVVLNSLVLYALAHSSLWFHSAIESAMAVLLCAFLVWWPLHRWFIVGVGPWRQLLMPRKK